ncbi:MAG: Xaa-Pro peptidase family protein [Halobacteria archaeon]
MAKSENRALARELRARRLDGYLIYAASEGDADMHYATRFLAPDPFLYLWKGGRTTVVVSRLEFGRARKEAKASEVRCMDDYGWAAIARRNPKDATAAFIAEVLRRKGLRRIGVPPNFPFDLALRLRRRGFALEPLDALRQDRTLKTSAEVAAMRRVQRATEEGMALARRMLRKRTTADRIRSAVDTLLLQRGCEPGHLIVAPGPGSADPHWAGSGPVRPGDPVVCDFFPRSLATRYFADMTRTFIPGRPSPRIRELYDLVLRAQKAGLAEVRHGASCSAPHQAAVEVFKEAGVEKLYIHSTGHGVGLEIHEPPRLAANGLTLRTGQVVTVEPGLYDPRVGGVRLEDMVLVKRGGCVNLTRFDKRWTVW